MDSLQTITYERTGRVARVTLDRPARGNSITFAMPAELAACVERANLDPEVHVILLAGNGAGFCAGYDLVEFAEHKLESESSAQPPQTPRGPAGSPLDPRVQLANHDPARPWDAMTDHALMSRNVRCFMSLFYGDKPVVCKVHGFCVGGGTDIALCADLLVIEDEAKFGYPPARVWGAPTTALWAYRVGLEKAKRLLFTGDSLSGREAVEWGLATEAPPRAQLDERCELLVERIARLPVNQLMMMKLLLNQTVLAQGLAAAQTLGTLFDAVARHTPEGYAFQQRAAEVGFKQAVSERDEPFGDAGRSTFKP